MESVYALAQRLAGSGIAVIPIRCDGSKAPAWKEWKTYELRLPTLHELKKMFSGRTVGIAAIGGKVSGNLECIDFEVLELFDKWASDIELEFPGLLSRLVITRTPSKGAHVWYRCDVIGGNVKLSRRYPTEEELAKDPRMKWETLVETRGENGYALLPGSPPACHEMNKSYEYASLGLGDLGLVRKVEIDQRNRMIDLARQFNSFIEEPRGNRPTRNGVATGLMPGDDFDKRGNWQEILEPAGWSLESGTWDDGRLCRPGKERGVSATVGFARGQLGEPLLHVFSSNAPIPTGTYGRFRAFAYIHHNQNFIDAATELYGKGYGDRVKPVQVERKATEIPADSELVTTNLTSVKAKPVHYLVPGRIAFRKLHLVAGRGGSGKSSLFRRCVADWTAGRPTFGLDYPSPGPIDVLLLCGEDGLADTIVTGLAAEGADLSRVEFIEAVSIKGRSQEFTLSPENIGLIRKKLAEKPSIRVIIIDPIASYVGRLKVDDSRATELRAGVLDPLNALTEETGVTIVMVAHLNKGHGHDAVDRIAGSAAYRDAVRAAYMVAPSPDDEDSRLLSPIKWNLPGFEKTSIPFRQVIPDDETLDRVLSLPNFDELGEHDRHIIRGQIRQMEFESPCRVDLSTMFGGKTTPVKKESASDVAKCKEWMVKFLATYAYPSNEINEAAAKAGYSFSVVKKAKAELGKKGTGDIVNRQFKDSTGKEEWWSGLGPSDGWKFRPMEQEIPE